MKTLKLMLAFHLLFFAFVDLNAQISVTHLDDSEALKINSPFTLLLNNSSKINFDTCNLTSLVIRPMNFTFNNLSINKSPGGLYVTGDIPNSPDILGLKKISVFYKEIFIDFFTVNIGGNVPKLYKNIEDQKLIVGEHYLYQPLILNGENLYSINKSSISLIETGDTIELSNSELTNNILKLFVKVNKLKKAPIKLKFQTTYIENNLFKAAEDQTHSLYVPIVAVDNHEAMLEPKNIYAEDIEDIGISPIPIKVTFPTTIASQTVTISSDDVDFEQPIIPIYNSNKCIINISKIKYSNKEQNRKVFIKFSINASQWYLGTITIKCPPKISRVLYNDNSKSELLPLTSYHLEFFGENLESLDFYINKATNECLKFESSDKYFENYRDYTMTFLDKNKDNIPDIEFGNYMIRYKRSTSNKFQIYKDTIPFIIVEPKKIFENYSSNIAFFQEKKLYTENDIKFFIDGTKIPYEYGSQYLELTANIYNDKGKIIKSVKYLNEENNNTSIFGNPYFNNQVFFEWNISKGITSDEIRPFSKVEVIATPSRNIYNQKRSYPVIIASKFILGRWYDHLNLSATLPPTIFLFKVNGLKSDSIEVINGAPKKKYYQMLNLNFGFGINRIFRDSEFRQTRSSMGMNFLWSNLAGTDSTVNNIIDKGNFTIFPYYQFSIMDFDSGISVPIFIGPALTYNPRREKFITSWMLGLSINLKIK
jgi:hypothetical protein